MIDFYLLRRGMIESRVTQWPNETLKEWETGDGDWWLTRWTRYMSNKMLISGRIASAISRNSNNLSNSEHITGQRGRWDGDIPWYWLISTDTWRTWCEYTGPGARNNDITSSDISGHGEIVIEHLTFTVWIASCFLSFFIITNCVTMMFVVMMLMMFTMCLTQ